MKPAKILLTGGAGYIGSHVVKELLAQGYWPIIYDNLSEGHKVAVLGGELIEADLCDMEQLRATFQKYSIDAVMHFAASSLVGESVEHPLKYYYNNVVNGMNLLKVMLEYKVNKIIFSSTAAVYGEPRKTPITEEHPLGPVNPYGRAKAIFETILSDFSRAYGLKYISLRYFNAAGADPEGKIGEDHNPETHLIPLVLKQALSEVTKTHGDSKNVLRIFGIDYPTADGTCIRDYIHVCDLANAHILAMEALHDGMESQAFNLGNGKGYSVKEVIEAARRATKKNIRAVEAERRPGDPAVLVASSEKIKNSLGWKPKFYKLEEIIETAWNWHKRNPNGF